jgi:hypothetical protein
MIDSIVDQGAATLRRFCFSLSSRAHENGFVRKPENFIRNLAVKPLHGRASGRQSSITSEL